MTDNNDINHDDKDDHVIHDDRNDHDDNDEHDDQLSPISLLTRPYLSCPVSRLSKDVFAVCNFCHFYIIIKTLNRDTAL